MARRGGPRSRILRATLGRRRQPTARACCDRRGGAPRAFPGGPIEALGKRFDPTLHEAVAMKERAEAPGTVVGVVEDGYTINGRLLRPARVVQKPGRTRVALVAEEKRWLAGASRRRWRGSKPPLTTTPRPSPPSQRGVDAGSAGRRPGTHFHSGLRARPNAPGSPRPRSLCERDRGQAITPPRMHAGAVKTKRFAPDGAHAVGRRGNPSSMTPIDAGSPVLIQSRRTRWAVEFRR
jgi:hypothetical protein